MWNLKNITRRQALRAAAAGAGIAAASRLSGAVASEAHTAHDAAPSWLTLLGRSEQGGRDLSPEVEGRVPRELHGSLYRNGPGLFERGGMRKTHLLDGDGLVQRLSFTDGQVRYQNAFVQTPKWKEEEAAGRYTHSTWSTRRPGGPLRNLGGGRIASQAGVTVYPVGDAVYALDEGNPAFAIDPVTLETVGERSLGDDTGIKAHTKLDPVTGEWLVVGQGFGRKGSIHALVYDRHGNLAHRHQVDDTPMVYFHDFLVTEHYFVYVLHPCELQPFGFMLGLRSVIDSLHWRPEKGSRIVLVPRAGGAPRTFEASGTFMWHALNAFERGMEIIADVVTYDHPDHFIGEEEPMLRALVHGRMGVAKEPGKVRRYTLDLSAGTLREEVLHAGNHEFPFVDPRVVGREHRVGYFAYAGQGVLQTGLKRMDMHDGAEQTFDFGERTHVGEPVFVGHPGNKLDEGWLIAQCLDGATERAFFALFDAQAIPDGPIAKLWLPHPLPISFHGWWKAV